MEQIERKRGALSTEEMEYIRENYKAQSLEEIAKHLRRKVDPVKKFLVLERLIEDTPDNLGHNTQLRNKLYKKPYWGPIREGFNDEEAKIFEEHWIEIVKQFQEDVQYTEELQICKFASYEVFRSRAAKQNIAILEQIADLEGQIDKQKKMGINAPPNSKTIIKTCMDQIGVLRNSYQSNTKEYNELAIRQDKITEELVARRSDRIKTIQDASKSWTACVKMFADEEVRREIGKYLELMRIAKEEARVKLSGSHQYLDGQIDQPLLTPLTVATGDEDE